MAARRVSSETMCNQNAVATTSVAILSTQNGHLMAILWFFRPFFVRLFQPIVTNNRSLFLCVFRLFVFCWLSAHDKRISSEWTNSSGWVVVTFVTYAIETIFCLLLLLLVSRRWCRANQRDQQTPSIYRCPVWQLECDSMARWQGFLSPLTLALALALTSHSRAIPLMAIELKWRWRPNLERLSLLFICWCA